MRFLRSNRNPQPRCQGAKAGRRAAARQGANWLGREQPALFCEISPELGAELRTRNGERVHIVTARGRIEAHALVTPRMRPIHLDDRVLHQVALPWHFGHRGLVAGDVANELIGMSEEPNVRIMGTKALLCRVERAASAQRSGKDRND